LLFWGRVRTVIYVDGFNLYYGALKGTPYKWLDLKSALSKILDPSNQIICIKYFTARVSSTSSDPHKADHQDAYIRALQRTSPELRVYFGQFTTHEVKAKLARPIAGQSYAQVLRTSEKGSDVNLAVHLLNDAWIGAYDCAVLVSRDSDLAEALCLVKTHKAQKKIGLIAIRGVSKELSKYADFVRHLGPTVLAASQLPVQIPGTNIRKPADW